MSGIVGRADLLCALFLLLAFLAYVKSTLTDGDEHGDAGGSLWLATAMMATVLSMLCKEVGITVLVSDYCTVKPL